MAAVNIAGRRFKSKKEAADEARRIIADYANSNGPRLIESGLDFEFVVGLASVHPMATQKIGCGIRGFFVDFPPPGCPGAKRFKCLWLERTDGSRTDISFREALSPTMHRQQVLGALRSVVFSDVVEFARKFWESNGGRAHCPVSGLPITPDQAHVDHYEPTFIQLAESWAGLRGGFNSIRVVQHDDGMTRDELADMNDRLSWDKYHRENAKLRVISIEANLGRMRS